MKKLFIILLCVCLCVIVFAGCEQKEIFEFVGNPTMSTTDLLGYYTVEVTGQVKNISEKDFDYAQIIFSVYDENEALLGTAIDNINYWSAGDVWNYKTIGIISSGVPAKVKLKNLDAF